ncbi:MAG TPA: creatininase family protein [Pirellulaceae bacterium]|nr:creatininase family protein [Pirellulaceae bacterium]
MHPSKSAHLEALNLDQVRRYQAEVVVIPFGATEPHNLHLPYGTDTWTVSEIAQRLAKAANARGGRVLILPTIPYGTETNLNQFPMAINWQPSTLLAVIRDMTLSLAHSGIRKIVLLNGHGGNDFKSVLRELYGNVEAHLFLINWYQVIADVYREIFDQPDDHAGEMETSLGLALFPSWVAQDEQGALLADAGAKRPCQFEAVNRGWVQLTRPWHLLTTQSGAGDPHAATAEKGVKLLDLLVDRLSPFLAELSNATADTQFPFQSA